MLAELIREFCKERDYGVYEGYSGGELSGGPTIGIIVKQDQNSFEAIAELTRYLETKEVDGRILDELEGAAVDDLGQDAIVYFPAVQDYRPPQP